MLNIFVTKVEYNEFIPILYSIVLMSYKFLLCRLYNNFLFYKRFTNIIAINYI